MMDRREFVGITGAAAAGLTLGASSLAGASQKRPNILLVLVDQMREDKWTPLISTPNLDRLRQRGVSFENHFVSASPRVAVNMFNHWRDEWR